MNDKCVVDTRDNSIYVPTHFHRLLQYLPFLTRNHHELDQLTPNATIPWRLSSQPLVSFVSPLSIHSRRIQAQVTPHCPQRKRLGYCCHRYTPLALSSEVGPAHSLPPPSFATTTFSTVTGTTTACSSEQVRNPVIIFPGLGNAAADYKPLAEKLRRRGHQSVTVVPIQRWQWSLNARGFFTRNYWEGTLTASPILDWYFKRVNEVVCPIVENNPQKPISFLGHSAGGWLTRLYVAMHAPDALCVGSMVTLGTPHCPPPEGTLDQTRGLLKYVEQYCGDDTSSLVCVAGLGIKGAPFGKGSVQQLVAYASYAAVCGKGNVDGDGVTPACAADVPGAKVVECACAHSMLIDADGWYGCDVALAKWEQYLT